VKYKLQHINSALAVGPRKTTGNLGGVYRSQELLHVTGLLVSGWAFEHKNPNLGPYLCCCLIWDVY
jgi:hypothetical protein